MARRKKRIPIGIENFGEMIQKNYYYVDKSLLIRDLLDRGGKVTLFTRPRRFGKTLNLSMIRHFFEDTLDEEENAARKRIFEGLKIMDAGEEYREGQCKYPVISLTLKSAKQAEFQVAYDCLKQAIIKEFWRHDYVMESLNERQKKIFNKISNDEATKAEMATSLAFLSECLKEYHHKNVIILIDEYDVPLENSYFRNFYSEMVDFIRSLFESALKTNDALEFAVITGCLRISKESIFTGMNHLKINSVLGGGYAEYFGFEPEEVEQMTEYFEMPEKMDILREWYDGYLFGKKEVYNPWSIINYVDDAIDGILYPRPYWSNTSSNDIVRHLINRADQEAKAEIETLIAGGTIEKPVHEDITYEEIYKSQDNLWNFLFFTGYLKKVSERYEDETIFLRMEIPNLEIRSVYKNSVRDWFREKLELQDFQEFYDCMEKEDVKGMQKILCEQLMKSISYMDKAENFYHGFMAGVLRQSRTYNVKSNRESGNGRGDIFVYPYDTDARAFILELKCSDRVQDLEKDSIEAVDQIVEKGYAQELFDLMFEDIDMYGIAFCGKTCQVYYGGKAEKNSFLT